MLKIGLVGGAKVFHGMSFAEIFNGFNKEEVIKNKWGPLYEARVERDARITHIWDVKKEDAREVAGICSIENVVDEMENMIGKVDGVLIIDDCTMKHQRRAAPFLKAGISTFIDKPFSTDIKEAKGIIALAKRYKTPLMSCSALRYARETEALRQKKDDIGEILTGLAVCREWQGSLIFYGIHALEMLYSIIGPGIKSVKSIGEKKKDIIILKYKGNRKFILTAYEDIAALFQVNLYGTKGNCSIISSDSGYFYSEMLRQFVTMVETRKEPFPLLETLEIIKTLVLSEKSRKNRGKEYAI